MTLPDAKKLYAVIDGTWPPSAKLAIGPWMIRIDQSGSSRVTAATAEQPLQDGDIERAEDAMRSSGQTPLFMIRQGEEALNTALASRGYRVKDPVNMYACPIDSIATQRPPPVSCFEVFPPLAAQAEIWAAGGIGAGRLAIMDRAFPPKTTILGRVAETPAGCAYIGIAGDCAMIHALEVLQGYRRLGLAEHMTRAAAFWAKENGADFLTLVTTKENAGANALYSSLGMTHVGHYHYRIHPEDSA